MTQADILSKLQTIFDGVFLEPVEVSATTTAAEVAEWDSLTHISLLVAIEKAFGIRFRVGEVEATQNVGELADLILKRTQER